MVVKMATSSFNRVLNLYVQLGYSVGRLQDTDFLEPLAGSLVVGTAHVGS